MISYNVIIGDTVTKLVIRIGQGRSNKAFQNWGFIVWNINLLPASRRLLVTKKVQHLWTASDSSVLLSEKVRGTVLSRREFVIVAVTVLITLPLSLYKNVAKLSKVSCFAFTKDLNKDSTILLLWSCNAKTIILFVVYSCDDQGTFVDFCIFHLNRSSLGNPQFSIVNWMRLLREGRLISRQSTLTRFMISFSSVPLFLKFMQSNNAAESLKPFSCLHIKFWRICCQSPPVRVRLYSTNSCLDNRP